MALDGLFLHKLCEELKAQLQNSRVEKIYQPSKDELVFVMRSKEGAKRLYLSAAADGARLHLTQKSFINPSNPPMLCMLLRKKFTSAWLDDITQNAFERVVTLHFSALNDFGDRVPLKIVCEIMGRYSNIIFTDANDVILDSVKRVGSSKSSVREVLPGIVYRMPPAQDKLNLAKTDAAVLAEAVCKNENSMLAKALLKTIQGISPLRCTEICVQAYGEDKPVYDVKANTEPLISALKSLQTALNAPPLPCMVSDDKKPIAFSFLDILQYGNLCQKQTFADLSLLLDAYYQNRLDTVKRNQSSAALLKVITSNIEKISRKLLYRSNGGSSGGYSLNAE